MLVNTHGVTNLSRLKHGLESRRRLTRRGLGRALSAIARAHALTSATRAGMVASWKPGVFAHIRRALRRRVEARQRGVIGEREVCQQRGLEQRRQIATSSDTCSRSRRVGAVPRRSSNAPAQSAIGIASRYRRGASRARSATLIVVLALA